VSFYVERFFLGQSLYEAINIDIHNLAFFAKQQCHILVVKFVQIRLGYVEDMDMHILTYIDQTLLRAYAVLSRPNSPKRRYGGNLVRDLSFSTVSAFPLLILHRCDCVRSPRFCQISRYS